ncbi:hypothetical protein EHQ61_04720 [Leptospira wolffii]|uniref:hypothetical protein n=1 Tax=Leptospira wolffii TaxID=409998 RepID=UPI0010842F88|nr:hypothetical protein [Leptospira wolffii]TGL53170.1 hypothetical protein EHQ61_04720 [Leptospira wolffii]
MSEERLAIAKNTLSECEVNVFFRFSEKPEDTKNYEYLFGDLLKELGYNKIIFGDKKDITRINNNCKIQIKMYRVKDRLFPGEFFLIGFPYWTGATIEMDFKVFGKRMIPLVEKSYENKYLHFVSLWLLPTFSIFWSPSAEDRIIASALREFTFDNQDIRFEK